MSNALKTWIAVLLSIPILWVDGVNAQDLQLLQPVGPFTSGIGVENLEMRTANDLSTSLRVDHALGVLDVIDGVTQQRVSVIDSQLTIDLSLAWQLLDALRLQLNLRSSKVSGNAFDTFEGTGYGFGDTALGLRWRFIDVKGLGLRVGTYVNLLVPTGDQSRFLGSGATSVGGGLLLTQRFDDLRFETMVGYLHRTRSTTFADATFSDMIDYRAGLYMPLDWPTWRLFGEVVGLLSATNHEIQGSEPAEILLGTSYGEFTQVSAALSFGLNDEGGSSARRFTVNLSHHFGAERQAKMATENQRSDNADSQTDHRDARGLMNVQRHSSDPFTSNCAAGSDIDGASCAKPTPEHSMSNRVMTAESTKPQSSMDLDTPPEVSTPDNENETQTVSEKPDPTPMAETLTRRSKKMRQKPASESVAIPPKSTEDRSIASSNAEETTADETEQGVLKDMDPVTETGTKPFMQAQPADTMESRELLPANMTDGEATGTTTTSHATPKESESASLTNKRNVSSWSDDSVAKEPELNAKSGVDVQTTESTPSASHQVQSKADVDTKEEMYVTTDSGESAAQARQSTTPAKVTGATLPPTAIMKLRTTNAMPIENLHRDNPLSMSFAASSSEISLKKYNRMRTALTAHIEAQPNTKTVVVKTYAGPGERPFNPMEKTAQRDAFQLAQDRAAELIKKLKTHFKSIKFVEAARISPATLVQGNDYWAGAILEPRAATVVEQNRILEVNLIEGPQLTFELVFERDVPKRSIQLLTHEDEVLVIRIEDVKQPRQWVRLKHPAIVRALLHPSYETARAAILRVRLSHERTSVEDIRTEVNKSRVRIVVPVP